jgi:hypothetical protein
MLRLPRRRMLSRTRSQKKQSADVNTLFHVLAENKGTWWLRFVISRTGSRGRLRFRHQMRQALEAAGSVGWRGALPYYYRRSITAQRLPFISCHSRSKHFGGCYHSRGWKYREIPWGRTCMAAARSEFPEGDAHKAVRPADKRTSNYSRRFFLFLFLTHSGARLTTVLFF